jgi:F5/8 type C domain
VRIPTEAAGGVAKASLSYRTAEGKNVAPATVEFNVSLSSAEVLENQKRAARIQVVQQQLMGLANRARAKALQTHDSNSLPRPPVNASYNVDEFEPVAARFVRFTILATADGSEPCLDELEIYSPASQENLARSQGAKTTASSLLPGQPAHQVHHLTDGRHGNAWSWISHQRGVGWAQVEFPAEAKVSRVVWSRDGSDSPKFHDRVPSKYRVEVSADGKSWNTVSTHEGRLTVDQWIASEPPSGTLDVGQQKMRQELLGELKKLRE